LGLRSGLHPGLLYLRARLLLTHLLLRSYLRLRPALLLLNLGPDLLLRAYLLLRLRADLLLILRTHLLLLRASKLLLRTYLLLLWTNLLLRTHLIRRCRPNHRITLRRTGIRLALWHLRSNLLSVLPRLQSTLAGTILLSCLRILLPRLRLPIERHLGWPLHSTVCHDRSWSHYDRGSATVLAEELLPVLG
jgi:hypothetical protein